MHQSLVSAAVLASIAALFSGPRISSAEDAGMARLPVASVAEPNRSFGGNSALDPPAEGDRLRDQPERQGDVQLQPSRWARQIPVPDVTIRSAASPPSGQAGSDAVLDMQSQLQASLAAVERERQQLDQMRQQFQRNASESGFLAQQAPAPASMADLQSGSGTTQNVQFVSEATDSTGLLRASDHLRALNQRRVDVSRTGIIERPDVVDRTPQVVPDRPPQVQVRPASAINEYGDSDLYVSDVHGPSCGPGCNSHHHGGWLWVFGVEETFLVPDRDGTLSSVTISTPFDTFTAGPKESMEIGPRLWFGIQKPCWQFLARIWFLNSIQNDYDPVLLGTGDTRGSIVDCDVQAFTVDAEVRRLFTGADGWNHYIGFGYRFAALENVSRVSATGLDTTNAIPAIVQADAFALSTINGSGFTVPFGGTKPIHCGCCSQLDFFYNLRGSVVFGGVDAAAQTSVVVMDPNIPGVANRFDAAAATGDDEMFIGEFQVGVRWTHELKCMPGIAYFQVAFEYQWWDADGGIAFSESAALVNANVGTASAISGPNNEISLIGYAIGAGMIW